MRKWLALTGALLIGGTSARGQGACPLPADAPRPLAIVLSGGGSRGLAHVGVLKVLDSLGVRPDIVVGTSMGALMGALYAGGLSGRQLDSLARAAHLETLFGRYTAIRFLTAGDFDAPLTVLPPSFVFELRDGGLRLVSPLAREAEINTLFNQVLLPANLAAAGDFDRLPVRFRAVATDMQTRETIVLGDGDLAEAVRASIAIPVVFTPVARAGRLLVDGGLTANAPIGVARALGAARVIVSDVGPSLADTIKGTTAESMLEYLVDELFLQPLDSLGARDVYVRPAVRDVIPLDFGDEHVGPLVEAGRHAAARALAGCAAAGRTPDRTPAINADARLISARMARLARERIYETVWLRPRLASRDSASADSLAFAPVATLAPRHTISLGIGYDSQEGARAWAASASVTAAGGRLRLGSALGGSRWRQRLLLVASGQRRHPLPRGEPDTASDPSVLARLPDPRGDAPPWPSRLRDLIQPELSLTISREFVRVYDGDGEELGRPRTHDAVLFAGLGHSSGAHWRTAAGAAAHGWSMRDAAFDGRRDGYALGGMLRTARFFAPLHDGPDQNFLPSVQAEGLVLHSYRRASGQADLGFRVGRWILLPRAGGGWSDGLPLSARLVLGGRQGFPGLRTGERRGDRAAFASIGVLRRIAGTLYARAEAGAGWTDFEGPRPPRFERSAAVGDVQGVEAGLLLATPFGPVSGAFGVASSRESVFKLAVGN